MSDIIEKTNATKKISKTTQTNLSGEKVETVHPRIILKDPEPKASAADIAREKLREAAKKRLDEGNQEKNINSY